MATATATPTLPHSPRASAEKRLSAACHNRQFRFRARRGLAERAFPAFATSLYPGHGV